MNGNNPVQFSQEGAPPTPFAASPIPAIPYHTHNGVDSPRISAEAAVPSSPITVYTATCVDVEDTSSETDVVTFTVPANTISPGDIVKIHFVSLFKWEDDSGSATTDITIKVKANAAEVVLHDDTNSEDITEYAYMGEISIQYTGTKLWVLSNPLAVAQPLVAQASHLRTGNLNETNTEELTGFDPTVDTVFKVSVEFSNTETNYWRVGQAKAYKI